jgi:chromosome segregation ATPase
VAALAEEQGLLTADRTGAAASADAAQQRVDLLAHTASAEQADLAAARQQVAAVLNELTGWGNARHAAERELQMAMAPGTDPALLAAKQRALTQVEEQIGLLLPQLTAGRQRVTDLEAALSAVAVAEVAARADLAALQQQIAVDDARLSQIDRQLQLGGCLG